MKKLVAFLMTAAISLQLAAATIVPAAAAELPPLERSKAASIAHKDVLNNVLKNGSFDNEEIATKEMRQSHSETKFKWVEDKNGGYFETDELAASHHGMRYYPSEEIPAGKYKLTFYVRTVYEGHKTRMCVMMCDKDGFYPYFSDNKQWLIVNVGDKWTKAEFYFDLKAPMSFVFFRGHPTSAYTIPFAIDEVSLVPVSKIPADMTMEIGEPVLPADATKSAENLIMLDPAYHMAKWDPEKESKYKVDGVMLNLDNTAHRIDYANSEQAIYDYVAQFEGTHVTDMVWNIAESKCVYPTDVYFGWYGDPQTQMVDGVISDVPGTENNAYTKHYNDLKMDYIKTLTKALPEAGINMWLSIRMNDHHDRGLEKSSLFTRYYFEHPEYRRVTYNSMVETSYAYLWDYSVPDIRAKFLGLINESLDRYDVYGYQLEFTRNIWLFKNGFEYEGLEIMNQFMRDADSIISIYEEKYGHPIKLSVQLAPTLQTNYDFGLDVMTWASEGLIDQVIPKGRYRSGHNEMPVALWKTLLDPYGIELVPDMDNFIKCMPGGASDSYHDIETYAGTAALYYAQGADKIHLYNILIPFGHIWEDKHKIGEYDPGIKIPGYASTSSVPGWWMLLTTVGSYEKLLTMNRKVLVTYQDVLAHWAAPDHQIPLNIMIGRSGAIRVGMGEVPEGATAVLRLGLKAVDPANPPIVYINSEPAKCIGVADTDNPIRTESDIASYEIPVSAYGDMFVVAEISPNPDSKMTVQIDYADVFITPAK